MYSRLLGIYADEIRWYVRMNSWTINCKARVGGGGGGGFDVSEAFSLRDVRPAESLSLQESFAVETISTWQDRSQLWRGMCARTINWPGRAWAAGNSLYASTLEEIGDNGVQI